MVDDGFIREVNEEIRHERFYAFWHRYGILFLGLVLCFILAVICFQLYGYFSDKKSKEMGDSFLTALTLADGGEDKRALEILNKIETSNFAIYPTLAAMRKAAILLEKGDKMASVAAFDAIAENPETMKSIATIAKLRAAYILVDTAPLTEIEQRVKAILESAPLESNSHPMRFAAREIMGISCWKAGKRQEALDYFMQNYKEEQAEKSSFYERASKMIELIQAEIAWEQR